jgi:hypothetical protein
MIVDPTSLIAAAQSLWRTAPPGLPGAGRAESSASQTLEPQPPSRRQTASFESRISIRPRSRACMWDRIGECIRKPTSPAVSTRRRHGSRC